MSRWAVLPLPIWSRVEFGAANQLSMTQLSSSSPHSYTCPRVARACRGLARRLLTGLCIAALLLGATVPRAAAESTQEKVDKLRRQIDEAAEKETAELQAVEESDKRLNEANKLVDELETQVAQARKRVAEAEAELEAATVRLKDAETKLAEAEASLKAVRDRVNRRAVQLYKHGRLNDTTAFFESGSLQEAEITLKYQSRLNERDNAEASALGAAVHDAEEKREELEVARSNVEAKRDQLAQEKERLEQSLADQTAVRDAIAAEVANHKKLLEKIQSDRGKWEQALAELEGQSRRIGGLALSRGSGKGKLGWPVTGPVVSAFGMRMHPILGYARMHAGIDIDAPSGAAIGAAASGTVVSAGWSGGYGNLVVIDHGDGLSTAYAHQSRLAVSSGQYVTKGQTIGYVGSTGLSTGPHLHFETRVNGVVVDPMPYFV